MTGFRSIADGKTPPKREDMASWSFVGEGEGGAAGRGLTDDEARLLAEANRLIPGCSPPGTGPLERNGTMVPPAAARRGRSDPGDAMYEEQMEWPRAYWWCMTAVAAVMIGACVRALLAGPADRWPSVLALLGTRRCSREASLSSAASVSWSTRRP
jgi:hypothetical protein